MSKAKTKSKTTKTKATKTKTKTIAKKTSRSTTKTASKSTKKDTPSINEEKSSGKALVIVESPGKVKTIGKFLGSKYIVRASIGHVRDLPSKGLGINVKNNFEPTYEILEDKTKVVKELKALAKKSTMVYLAQDPDREGEAIAWHLYEILGTPEKTKRIVCNEITKSAMQEAIAHPRKIDIDRVYAQQARRILDRLVGYKISPMLWRKIGGRSAGRVQSVALKLIMEREIEIRGFVTEEYWSVHAEFEKEKIKFLSNLHKWDGQTIISPKSKETKSSLIIRDEKQVKSITKEIEKENFVVSNIEDKESTRNPQPPFITSTLQRAGANHLGYTVKKVMKIAQELYEGRDIGEEEPVGLITYMRTDSTRIADEAQKESNQFIVDSFGKKYYPPEPRVFVKKNKKNVQDAHEAIRPTSVYRTPEQLKKHLTLDQYKVYKAIWERFLASQMASAKLQLKTIEIEAGKAIFRTNATTVSFDGFLKAFEDTSQQTEDEEVKDADQKEGFDKLPTLKVKEKVALSELDPKQHFTEPPSRYNEASLVKRLEELGIGRPSTYASTISTIVDRKYAEKLDRKVLQPTFLGEKVTELLNNHFSKYIDYEFTAKMELNLDEIEDAKLDWDTMLTSFYDGFSETLKTAQEELKNVHIKVDKKCPKCENDMVMKGGRFGPFLGCINYPECKGVINLTKDGQPVPEAKESDEKCPKCNSNMLVKYGPYGQYLLCTDESCQHKANLIKKVGIKCPGESCEGEIVEKKTRRGKIFYGCSSWSKTKCTMAFWDRPLDQKCSDCGSLLTFKKTAKASNIACSKTKECGFKREATEEEIAKYSEQLVPAML